MSAALRNSSIVRNPRQLAIFAIAALIGAATGASLAQEQIPGHLDSECANRCMTSGEPASYCGKVCWVPDIPTRVQPGEVTDAVCLRGCLARGGRYSDCKPVCKLRSTN